MTCFVARNPRRAMVVLSVMISLAVVMLLMVAWFHTLSLERQQVRTEQNRVQAEYLAESALARAAARLAAANTYTGETFIIRAESLGGSAPAKVTIKVEGVPDDPQARLVAVSTRYPAEGVASTQRSKQQRITLVKKEPAP